MNISIIVPFINAETRSAIWAFEESAIDFRRDFDRAARCTTAFAAVELKNFLARTLTPAEINFTSRRPVEGFFIELRIEEKSGKNETFTLELAAGGVIVTGRGRTGVLYGAYEFLHLQGWRWFSPEPFGEIPPPIRETPVLPKEKKTFGPSMPLGRGFEFEGLSRESAPLLIWMARNRLNLSGYRFATGPLGEKLGMSSKIGGHIFEAILNPDRRMPSGKSLWEEHQDWFGLPPDGIRKKEEAQKTQFCFSQPDLMKFLTAELLQYLMGEWKQADRIDIWTFDTWGSTCMCDRCRQLGNSSDQLLHFLSAIRSHLNQARADGRLDHDVRMVGCAYEGMATLDGPTKPVPRNLIEAGDYLIFSPIIRCYDHDFTDPGCSWNDLYARALRSWFTQRPAIGIMVNEYYNVSKFEDLPLLFTRRIAVDLPAYHSLGVTGLTYMHLPLINWGMRTLTQVLYAELAWNIHADIPSLLKEYFTLWYGPYADRMRKVYDLLEEAWTCCSQWRAWRKSILSDLLEWDGQKPKRPLGYPDHLKTSAEIIASGRKSIDLMERALSILNHVLTEEKIAAAKKEITQTAQAVNPIQARELEKKCHYEKRLGEDRRLLLYGLDTMTLMTELVTYHDALYCSDLFPKTPGGMASSSRPCLSPTQTGHGLKDDAMPPGCQETPKSRDNTPVERAWRTIEQLEERLDSYFVPMTWDWPGPGFESRDALTRTQLRDVVRRCRKYRLSLSEKGE